MIIVTATLQDLQSGAGVAVTGEGSVLPMREVIRWPPRRITTW